MVTVGKRELLPPIYPNCEMGENVAPPLKECVMNNRLVSMASSIRFMTTYTVSPFEAICGPIQYALAILTVAVFSIIGAENVVPFHRENMARFECPHNTKALPAASNVIRG